jgi:ABC-2 type transport system permease protein
MNAASWRRIWAMILKEIWVMITDPRGRITLIAPPLIELFLMGYAATLEVKHITLGVYNRDNGAWSQEVVDRLAGSPNVSRLIRLDSPRALRKAIDERQVIAAVVFDQSFSADISAGRPAQVQAIFDGRRSNAAQIVSGYLGRIVASVGADTRLAIRSAGPPSAGATLVTNWFNPNLDYMWFIMPSLVVTMAALSVLAVTAQTIARERELGTFEQMLVSPLRTHEILIGKIVPSLLLGLFNSTVYILLIPLVIGVPLTGSVFLLYFSLFCFLISMICAGLLISTLSHTQQQAFLGMFLAMVPLILSSGFASPVDNMPHWLRILTQANPLKHFLIISEGIFLKAMPARDVFANVWPLIIIAAVMLIGSGLFFRSRVE